MGISIPSMAAVLLGAATDGKLKGVRELKKRRNQWPALLLVRLHRRSLVGHI
jgi:hypothetical protein